MSFLFKYNQSVPIYFEVSKGSILVLKIILLFVVLLKINSKFKPSFIYGKVIVIELFILSNKYNVFKISH